MGAFLEDQSKQFPYIDTNMEAGWHLFQAGEYDRSNELLGSASDWLQHHGRVREGLAILLPFLEPQPRARLDRRLLGQALGTIGSGYRRLGEVRKAIEYYEQALEIDREIGDRRAEGDALGNLGNAYAILGEVRKAIGYYEQQLVIVHEIGDRQGEGNAIGNLGNAYRDLGEVRKAIGCHKQALEIHREIGDRRGEGADLGNLGNAYADLGDKEKAKSCFEIALNMGREIEDPQIIEICEQGLQKLE